jgi:hypothetical protein
MNSTILQYTVKILLTAVLVVSVSEVAKRSSFWGATLASLPLTSVLAFTWLYIDTGDTQRVGALSQGVLWLVLPSLVLFIALPLLLKAGVGFWLSLVSSCAATALAYVVMVKVLAQFGIRA